MRHHDLNTFGDFQREKDKADALRTRVSCDQCFY